jgi:hypothetical protein
MHIDGLEPPAPDPERLPVEDLELYEQHGGHTLRRHVDTRPGDEFKRILREGIAADGRFVSRSVAQECVRIAVWSHSDDIRAWLGGPEPDVPFTCVQDMGHPIGRCLTWDDISRGRTVARPVTAVRIVLRRNEELPGGYTVVTAYPQRAPRSARALQRRV